ncbi:MAG: DUF362 domain-containing protein [Candidatus Latescibacterota bacterium]
MASSHRRSRVPLVALAAAALALLVWADVQRAAQLAQERGRFMPVAAFPPARPPAATQVAIVRSDDPALPDPAPLTRALSFGQIEAMTRRAVELAGGLQDLVHPGDKVLIKPCIVTPDVQRNTDVRVVKAVVRLVHAAAGGDVEILVGEGSAYPAPEDMPYVTRFSAPQWERLWDAGGYDALPEDPDLQGINLRLVNLNGPREDLVQVAAPLGGLAAYRDGHVWVHKEVLAADVHISVPALKLHSFTGLTVGLKNNIGLYPGTIYGYPKEQGVPQDGFRNLLVHQTQAPHDYVDEEIVDMAGVAGIDFSIVDAINCNYHAYRRNAIVAGRDVVAVDHVAARLAGLNPDDIAHITLAALVGLGTSDAEQIQVVGAPIDSSWTPFRKESRPATDFGQGNRVWLLRGPFAALGTDAPMDHPFLPDEVSARPAAAQEGWSEPIYFFDDRIDLASYFGLGRESGAAVGYAFTLFDAPQAQRAELWLGSDEALRVYLNGQQVYDYAGYRAYGAQTLVLDKVPVDVRQGENALLVKVLQESQRFDFALNICQPEANAALDGNRVTGLRFRTEPVGPTAVAEEGSAALPAGFGLAPNYPNPFNGSTVVPFRVPAGAAGVPVRLTVYSAQGQLVRTLVDRVTGPGEHLAVWDGRDGEGVRVGSGVYLCRLQAGPQAQVRRLLLLQ